MQARSCYHCCSVNAMNITCSQYVFVTLVIQHPVRMCHIVNFCLPHCLGFSHITSKKARFSEKKVTEHKMRVLMSSTRCVRNISHSKKKRAKMCTGLNVTYPLLLSDFNPQATNVIYIWSTHSCCFQIIHNDAAQSVGLWTSDQLVAETST